MIRRFNYTKRIKLAKSDVAIELSDARKNEPPTFTANLDFSSYDLPSDARIVISSYRLSFAMRFDWGTVSDPTPPEDTRLTETPEAPQFRVMVLAPDDSGRILAMADRVKPVRSSGQQSLLWLNEAELGNEVWRLKIGDGMPTLEVNQSIGGISGIARSDQVFQSLVIPDVLREILRKMIIDDDASFDDPDSEWHDWMEFVKQIDIGDLPDAAGDDGRDAEAATQWIDSWIAAFLERRLQASRLYQESKAAA